MDFKEKKYISTLYLIAGLFILSVQTAWAETINIAVLGQSGKKIEMAAVTAFPVPSVDRPLQQKKTIVDQIDKEYVDFVNVIRRGTSVVFPNHDNIRHHIYSFSPAKKFEIPLYKEVLPAPVTFDKTGIISLGCNIHDWMSAFVYVVDTPYFTKTDSSGQAVLEVPSGVYDLEIWHPRLIGSRKSTRQRVQIDRGRNEAKSFVIKLKKLWKPRRGPISSNLGGGGYH
ncbi:MAG: methylamine utilization protein [Nitrospiria bacterium]